MRFFIHLRYIALFILLFACYTLAGQNQDSINCLLIDSLKRALNTQKLDSEKEMKANGALGIFYNVAGEYDSARLYLNRALNLPGGKEHEGGRLITNLANSYGFQGRYVEALKYYMEALQVSERLATMKKKDKLMGQSNIVRVMANIAEIHYLTGNRKQALYYAEQAVEKYKKLGWGNAYLIPQPLYVAASVHLDRGDVDKAEAAMLETYTVADSLCRHYLNLNGNPAGMYMYVAYGKEGLAQVCLARKDYAGALEYAAEALKYAELNGDPTITAKILQAFSDIHLAQGNYEASGQYAAQAVEMFPDYRKVNPGATFNAAAARLFAGDKEETYEYFRTYSVQMKENADKQFRETMASMEILYETEKKEMRISDLERKNIQYICIGIFALLLAIAIYFILRQKIKNEQKEKQLIAANAVLEWEKKERKRFASDLHDGINGMLSAAKLELNTAEENLQNVRNQLDECIETIRRMARGMMPSSLERYGLKAALEDYCRLFPNVDFHFFGEEKRINERQELTVYYCAYELVNNAFRHSGAQNINVQLVQDAGAISLTVQDDGCGFDEQNVTESSGLKNIRDRVAVFNGKIDIVASPGNGTETNIELKTANR